MLDTQTANAAFYADRTSRGLQTISKSRSSQAAFAAHGFTPRIWAHHPYEMNQKTPEVPFDCADD